LKLANRPLPPPSKALGRRLQSRLISRVIDCIHRFLALSWVVVAPRLRSLSSAWMLAVARTELPRIRFHDLRHAHATHLLASGVHPKVASERLGHSQIGITLDLYSHVLPGMQEDAAARVDDALRQALQKRATSGIR
jgi:integrase